MTPDVPVLKKSCGCKYSKPVYIDFGIKKDFLNPEKYKDYIASGIYQEIVIHDNYKYVSANTKFVSMNSNFENEYYKETYLANFSLDENYQITEIFITYTKTYFKEILNGEAYKSIISRKRLKKGSEVKIEVSSKYDEELLFDNDLLICL